MPSSDVARVRTREIPSTLTGERPVAASALAPRTPSKISAIVWMLVGLLPTAALVILIGEGWWPATALALFAAVVLVRILAGREVTFVERLRGDARTTLAVGSAAAVGVTLTVLIFVLNLAIARVGERGER